MRDQHTLEAILGDIGDALLAGRFDRIDQLTRAQDLAIAQMDPGTDRARLETITLAAHRNARLIKAVREGVLMARRAFQEPTPEVASIRTYGRDGEVQKLSNPRPAIQRQS